MSIDAKVSSLEARLRSAQTQAEQDVVRRVLEPFRQELADAREAARAREANVRAGNRAERAANARVEERAQATRNEHARVEEEREQQELLESHRRALSSDLPAELLGGARRAEYCELRWTVGVAYRGEWFAEATVVGPGAREATLLKSPTRVVEATDLWELIDKFAAAGWVIKDRSSTSYLGQHESPDGGSLSASRDLVIRFLMEREIS